METNALTEIRTAIRRLLPPGVTSSVGLIADAYPDLPQAEFAVTGKMTQNRFQEFSAGRAHARAALQELGLHAPTVPVGPDRAPLWPQGFVGSISHAGELALAVAARCTVLPAIGIDLEPSLPLDVDLLSRVCRPEEIARLKASPEPLRSAKLIFSAKESVYKCLAPLMGLFLEFDHLEVRFGPDDEQFCVRGHGPVATRIGTQTVAGRFAEAGAYWVTVAWQRPMSQSGQL